MKNMLATLLLSQGTPMLLAGDEFGRTQKGNNNAYCQDNEISWFDWNHDDRAERLINFVRKLTGLRHRYPILRRTRFLTGEYSEELGVKDVSWINTAGEEMREEHWKDANTRCFGMLLDGRAQTTGIRKRGEEATLLIIFNPWQDVVKFKLPPQNAGNGLEAARRHQLPGLQGRAALPDRPRVRGHRALAAAARAGLRQGRWRRTPRAERAPAASRWCCSSSWRRSSTSRAMS